MKHKTRLPLREYIIYSIIPRFLYTGVLFGSDKRREDEVSNPNGETGVV